MDLDFLADVEWDTWSDWDIIVYHHLVWLVKNVGWDGTSLSGQDCGDHGGLERVWLV